MRSFFPVGKVRQQHVDIRSINQCPAGKKKPKTGNYRNLCLLCNWLQLSAVNASGRTCQFEDENCGVNETAIIIGAIMAPSDLSPLTERSEQVSSMAEGGQKLVQPMRFTYHNACTPNPSRIP